MKRWIFVAALMGLTGYAFAEPETQKQDGKRAFPFEENFIATAIASTVFESAQPSLTISKDLRVSGFAGCNTYNASAYPLIDGRFKVGPVAVTKKACDSKLMRLEEVYLAALRSGIKWTHAADGRGIIVTTQFGPMKFERSF